jgi:hypothetical protein
MSFTQHARRKEQWMENKELKGQTRANNVHLIRKLKKL